MLHSIHNLMLTQAGDFPEALNSWRTVRFRNKKNQGLLFIETCKNDQK